MDELITRLNTVLSWELAGVIQYLHHSVMVSGPMRLPYAEFFHDGSKEARTHAEAVANKITALGGVPTVEPATIRQATTLDDMLGAALALERDALAAWEAALEVADQANQGTAFWIEEFVAHEQEHVDELVKLTRPSVAASTAQPAGSQAG